MICEIHNALNENMNIRDIALRDDISLLEEWLDLDIKVKHEDIRYIFENCSNRIKEYYMRRYKNDHHTICIAIDSGFLDRQLIISDTLDDTLEYITTKMIEEKKVIFIANILHNLPSRILSCITIDNVKGTLIYSWETRYVLEINPDLVHVYQHIFDSCKYDYETLAILIQNNRVTYPYTSIHLDSILLDIVNGVREIIPNWFIPLDSINYERYIDINILYAFVGLGIEFPYRFCIYLDEYDEDMSSIILQYGDDETLLEAYILGYISSFPEPTELRLVDISNDEIDRLFQLGEEYWLYITFYINMFNTIDLSDQSLRQLNAIKPHCCEFNIYGPYSYYDIILLYEFIDDIEDLKVEHDLSIKNNKRRYSKYKRGIRRLWKQYKNQLDLIIFICENIPSLISELESPIPYEYYKFMDKKLLLRLNRVERMVQYSDVEFLF